jgi:IclR family transcriptional regulator, KDG regulon repressor
MSDARYSAPSVQKAFRILHAVADSSAGVGVSELSKKLKIGKSTVHGIAAALEELGILVRDPVQKKYTLGYTLVELGRKVYARWELREVARSAMQRLMQAVGETVFLGIMNGDHATILDVVESQNAMKITSPPGTRIPLLAGAAGRVFLAQLEQKHAKEILEKMGLPRYTAKSVTDAKQFLREIEETRRNGFAVDDEEYIPGVRAIAAPVPSPSLSPAAVWVVGFTSTVTDQKTEMLVSEIRKATRAIALALNPAAGK